MNARKLLSATLVSLCALAGGLLFTSAPALASNTYAFSKSFGSACVVAESGPCPGEFDEPQGVAVNEKTGDVYVADTANNRVEYFTAEGEYKGEFNGSVPNAGGEAPPVPFETPRSVAVDNDPSSESYGDVYVTDVEHAVIDKFKASGEYINQITGAAGELFTNSGERKLAGIAVGSNGKLWVGLRGEAPNVSGKVLAFSDATENIFEVERKLPAGYILPAPEPGLGVDASEDIYVSNTEITKFSSSGEVLITNLEYKSEDSAQGVAVEAVSGDPYVVYSNHVNRFTSGGKLLESFGSEQLSGGDGIAVNAATHQVYVADAAANQIDLYDAPVEKPSVEDQAFANVSGTGAALSAQINTHGLTTTYAIEYGPTSTYGTIAKTGTIPGSFEGKVAVSVTLEGALQPETTYHFRLVAKNKDGTEPGGDVTFTTLSDFVGLPDGRGYEMVSPVANANGDVYEPHLVGGLVGGGNGPATEWSSLSMRASADGNVVQYVAGPPATGGNGNVGAGKHGNEYLATRAPGGGWSTVDLETPGLDKAPFEALLPSELSNSGTSAVPQGSDRLFESKEALLEGEGALEKELAEAVKRELEEKKKLEEEAAKYYAEGDPHDGGENKDNEAAKLPQSRLYDSIAGRQDLVETLPDGKAAANATFGGPSSQGADLSHVISADGSRVFWTDSEEGSNKDHIYVRESGDLTVPVSVGAAQFWTASPDGRYAFYTEGEKLLRFDAEAQTREQLAGEGPTGGANVQGVIGASEDGSYVYFVAGGVLADNANSEQQKAVSQTCIEGVGTQCNLYVRHNGVTTFIATLSGSDNSGRNGQEVDDWQVGLEQRSAEVTPDGRGVVFESRASLTGYDNNSAAQVFVYDADTAGLSCVSCNPTGAPPTLGVPATLPRSFDQPQEGTVGGPAGGSFQHRWISEDGDRVFFESAEPLVAQDTNGKTDVYEWERENTGSCPQAPSPRADGGCIFLLSGGTSSDNSWLLDASASGDDVFIVSRAQLTPQDRGDTYEVYDVRVGATQAPAEQACTGTGCQGLPAASPIFATPSSATITGSDNVPGGRASNPPTKKLTKKTVKCAKGKKLSHNKCVKVKGKKKKAKAKKARRASNDRRTK
jgi:hypothetical protein